MLIGVAPLIFWGFFSHKKINENACYALPDPIFGFYKENVDYIREHSVDPDKRRHSTVGEAAKHYIDLDHYSDNLDSLKANFPRGWHSAVEKFGMDSLNAYGVGPYNAINVYYALRKAFEENDKPKILRLSAELGHYIGDLHVPLHTTQNYNGQLSNQEGIHAFWESRLPELFYSQYDMLFDPVSYVHDVQNLIWETVFDSHKLVSTVLEQERLLNIEVMDKYTNEERGAVIAHTYSREYSEKYHLQLNGMVEERMRKATIVISALWYTAWVDSGQPSIANLK
jgi:hypothetical protein